jgi:hypothetical protein
MFEDMPLERVDSQDDKYSGDLHRRLQSCIKYLPLLKACWDIRKEMKNARKSSVKSAVPILRQRNIRLLVFEISWWSGRLV